MKAMILAAGYGKRMRPLTEKTPKPLLPVAGKPLIDYHLEKLAAAGFRDVVVNTSWLGQQIQDYLGDGERYGLRIQCLHEPEPLETAGGIINALPVLGEEPFLLVNGDVWSDIDFDELRLPAGKLVHLVMVPNPEHNPAGDFKLGKKAKLRTADADKGQACTFAGVSVISPKLFDRCAPGEAPLKPFLLEAINLDMASGQLFEGRWADIGTPERLAELDAELKA